MENTKQQHPLFYFAVGFMSASLLMVTMVVALPGPASFVGSYMIHRHTTSMPTEPTNNIKPPVGGTMHSAAGGGARDCDNDGVIDDACDEACWNDGDGDGVPEKPSGC